MTEQRFSFDGWAEDYDAYRPGYPAALFADLAALGLADRPVLEIGCGTGKATEGLVTLGRPLVALDPGAGMIGQAVQRVGDAPVRFVHTPFEAWAPEGGPFGLIACAQAWHWIDPALGFAKAAGLLADDGVLALFGNEEVGAPEPAQGAILAFHTEIRGVPDVRYGGGLYGPQGSIHQQFQSAPEFEPPRHRAYHRAIAHTADSYTALTATYSDVQAQPAARRDALLEQMRDRLRSECPSFEVQVDTHLYWAQAQRG